MPSASRAPRKSPRTTDSHDFGPCKVIILAGGFGTRLAERTDELPKPMVEVGERPILWHILKIYSHYGFNDFLIACGYKSDIIKRFFLEYREQMSDLVFDFANGSIDRVNATIEPWRIAVVDTGAESMTGGRIKRLEPHVGSSTFLMTYGDGVADVNLAALLKFHKSHGKLATFTAVRRPPQFGVPTMNGNQVVRFAEKPASETDWISGGFFAMEPGIMKYIQNDSTNFELESMRRLAEDGELMAYKHEGFWQPMDTLRDVRKLDTLWNSSSPPWKVWTS